MVNPDFLKHLSYNGASRLPEFMSNWKGLALVHTCPKTGQRYIDVNNAVYSMVFRKAWPAKDFALSSAFRWFSNEKLGDYLEALLGWRYIRVVQWEEQLDDAAEDIIQAIEKACLAQWCIVNNRYSRDAA